MSSAEEHGWPDKIVGPSPIPLNETFSTLKNKLKKL